MNAHQRRKAARAYVRAHTFPRDRLTNAVHRSFCTALMRMESWQRTWWAWASQRIAALREPP